MTDGVSCSIDMQLYIFVLAGAVLSLIFGFNDVQNERWYALATATLLAIGLYSSTYGISVREARRHLKLIISAVTLGVVLKAFIVGSVLTWMLKSPFGYILGIIVAQIDPLSTAALLRGKRLSKKAKTILGAWSSFDDPVTVILSLYTPVLIAGLAGVQWHIIGGTMQDRGIGGYLAETGLNLLFALGVYIAWIVVRHYAKARNYVVLLCAAAALYLLVVVSFSVAIYFFWMLGIAVIGLFMRPAIEKAVQHVVQWALCLAALLIGILLWNGVHILPGIVLGMAAFAAQMFVGYILCRKLSRKDRLHIAFAQQNGITAIILALLFEPYYPGTIAIVAPAILVINALHLAANRLLDAHMEHGIRVPSFRAQAEKLRAHLARIES